MVGDKQKILFLGEVYHAHDSQSSLQSSADSVHVTTGDRESFLRDCRSGRFDGCTVAYRTIASYSITGQIDAEVVNALPKSLKFLASCAAGYDHIDVPACSERDPPILVANVPNAPDNATADTNMFLILGALRNLNSSIFSLREGNWRGKPAAALGHDPQGKTLGILGMGGIGRNLKRKAEAFGMRVIYHNRTKLSDELAAGAGYVGFDELLQESDVLSLNLPLNAKTRHIISTPQFEKMKDGAVVVNTARGAVIDEEALVQALDAGKIFSVGLDVYENEPEIHPGLIRNPNVFLLPHMGTWTYETILAMEESALANVNLALTESRLLSQVAEQKDLKHT